MHLLYLDESGKSGATDYSQPWYVLGGLVVHESVWLPLERELNTRIDELVPPPRADAWELHMAHIFHGKSFFKGMPRQTRYALVDAVFDAIETHSVPMIFIGVDKQAHHEKYAWPDPVEALAYRFMLERYDAYLVVHPGSLWLCLEDLAGVGPLEGFGGLVVGLDECEHLLGEVF
ncbi:MAG: DUF3800 domain-containing protein, partial [Solirubrobacteraceae bacterium]